MSAEALSVEKALAHIVGAVEPLAPIELPLLEAYGCVLSDDVVAEQDVPALAVAEADGFAVRAADIHAASAESPITLTVVGWSRPGRPPQGLGWGAAVRVVPGSPIPDGADSVVVDELATSDGERVQIAGPIEPGTLVRPAGSEVRAGEVLIPARSRITGPELGMLATAGRATAPAHPKVRVAVMPVGELVEPGEPAALGQSRDTVSYALAGALRDAGAVPYRAGIVRGAEESVREAIISNLSRADAILCVGDVFAGDGHDLITSGLGSVETVHVAMAPGGIIDIGRLEGEPYFGLPLSPVAALVAFEILVRPAVLTMMGRTDFDRPEVHAALTTSVEPLDDVTRFLPVVIERAGEGWRAAPGDELDSLDTLVRANGLATLAPGTSSAEGDEVPVRLFRAGRR